MGVEGTASASEIIAAVEAAGYGASLKNAETGNGGAASAAAANEMLKDTETPKMKKRLIASLIFLIPLMYVSMGHMMWGWPLPSFMAENHIATVSYTHLVRIRSVDGNKDAFCFCAAFKDKLMIRNDNISVRTVAESITGASYFDQPGDKVGQFIWLWCIKARAESIVIIGSFHSFFTPFTSIINTGDSRHSKEDSVT